MSSVDPAERFCQYTGFVRKHEPGLRGFVARRCYGSEIDDIVQGVLLVAWRRFDHVLNEVPESFRHAWLCRVAYQTHGNQLRATSRRMTHEARFIRDRNANTASMHDRDGFDEVDERELVDRTLARLDEGDRQVLLAVVRDGFSAEELAVILGCSPVAARKRVSRAYRRVREVAER